MNESSPAPPLQIFFTDAEVFKPALIEKTEIAVGIRTVQKRRSSINDAPQYIFGGSCLLKLTCITCRRTGLVSGGLSAGNCRTHLGLALGRRLCALLVRLHARFGLIDSREVWLFLAVAVNMPL